MMKNDVKMKPRVKRFLEKLAKPKSALFYAVTRWGRFLPDREYLSLLYLLRFNRKLNFNAPQTFTEKLNWLKLNDKNPKYTLLVDKYAVKEYVKDIIGDQYVVPCYGTWNNLDEIDFSQLPQKFVLKVNHDSSGAYICTDKSNIHVKELKSRFDKLLRRNWFWHLREWPYRNISPKILAEMYLSDGFSEELRDYKFLCFHGIPKYMYCTNKGSTIYENFYDMEFLPIDISRGFEKINTNIVKPSKFDEMKRLATKLSSGIPFVRIDFFEVGGQVYFSEFTFYDWGGFRPFTNDRVDFEWGDYINLDIVRKRQQENKAVR